MLGSADDPVLDETSGCHLPWAVDDCECGHTACNWPMNDLYFYD